MLIQYNINHVVLYRCIYSFMVQYKNNKEERVVIYQSSRKKRNPVSFLHYFHIEIFYINASLHHFGLN